MGNLLPIMLNDEFDQLALFQGGLIKVGGSIATLARLACTCKLGKAWTRFHLRRSGRNGVLQLLENLPPTLACKTLEKLMSPQEHADGYFVSLTYPPTPTPVLWTAGEEHETMPVHFTMFATRSLNCDPVWSLRRSHTISVFPLYCNGSIPFLRPTFGVSAKGHALFRTFDDIVHAIMALPPLSLSDEEDVIQSHKRRRFQ